MESLTHEQDKLILMGTIKPSKDQALVPGDSKVNSEDKKKDKKPLDKKGDNSRVSRGVLKIQEEELLEEER